MFCVCFGRGSRHHYLFWLRLSLPRYIRYIAIRSFNLGRILIISFADHINTASPILTRKPPPQVFADVGSTVRLCCEADGHVVWSRSGRALASLPYFQQDGCLTIRSARRERAGEYTCRASNQFGISEATSEVIFSGNVICH